MSEFVVTWSIQAKTVVTAPDRGGAIEAVYDYFENRDLRGDGRQAATVETMSILTVTERQQPSNN